MRRALLITSLLALMFIGAYAGAGRLVRLIIVNKSGLPVEVQLTGLGLTGLGPKGLGPKGLKGLTLIESSTDIEEHSYYLRIPKGDRLAPTEKSFTIVPDYYAVQPYYIELWDPVYGSTCSALGAQTLDINRNIKVFILECNRRVPNAGDVPLIKFGGAKGRQIFP
jgi:hypothetical protein